MNGIRLKSSFVAALAALACSGHAADQIGVTFERNVAMQTRDGVTLKSDVYRPAADGKFPVLLQRTPYDKNSGTRKIAYISK